jgi:hypothetical protein
VIPRETSPDAFAAQARALRRLTAGERLAKAMALCDDVRAMCEAGVRRRHAEFDEFQVREEVGRIVLRAAPKGSS